MSKTSYPTVLFCDLGKRYNVVCTNGSVFVGTVLEVVVHDYAEYTSILLSVDGRVGKVIRIYDSQVDHVESVENSLEKK